MDPDSLFSLLLIAMMILWGMYFSAAETAFSALNRIRIKNMAEEGSRRAALVLKLHEDFDNLLSTLLVLNNVVTLIAAALSTLLFVQHFGDIGATLSTIVLTIIVVFFGDITPKSLAKESPERFAMFCAPLIHVLMVMNTPVNFIFAQWKIILSRVFNTTSDDRMTEEELYSIVEEAQNDGVIDENDKQLIENAIEFNEKKALDILTPRIDIAGISVDSSVDEIAQMFIETEFSRLPVYSDTIDHIVGVVHMRDFFNYIIKKEVKPLSEIFSPPLFVAPSMKMSDLFKEFQEQKSHMAVVTDEYGGTAGIVTMEDILEELVGDIWDESDEIIVEFEQIDNNQYKVICSAYVKDLFSFFQLSDDTEAESTSVSGWIMDMLGKMPEKGDTFTFEKLSVIVHKIEQRRVLECIITVNDKYEQEKQSELA